MTHDTAQTREALVELRAIIAEAIGDSSRVDPLLLALEAAGVRFQPDEPTRHMLVAAHMVERDDIELTEDEHRAMYAAFLSASPYAKDTP